ncbi:pentatricopeptide repeat-containing protein At1g06710, mitochondrial [Macadamia integrifolia]|uniref:pentatricopeptide repeat-containing protein At1g06710, mitochondrial n=1 Tax=Macadamia integrifolia TaxID=60698 RepID=UPI001C4FD8CC|nr:pentatricopeptide repeat-containing protein At1g06710, mitochondrial [Macadamia integrifolia]XP_042516231.1 pentatricopeptide repeat-containing protein At1g06710, mitochondrial [Macadamia integrifolia]XP_042516232.1 pentatricopeptide repeat-containing protein At1g06710, mitochondrial [Macadamia integrifolia]XP_042516233.1 pentatricopeptide repeat-containing protein At1g06710, mitochondrial [Macadamia integrifolia]
MSRRGSMIVFTQLITFIPSLKSNCAYPPKFLTISRFHIFKNSLVDFHSSCRGISNFPQDDLEGLNDSDLSALDDAACSVQEKYRKKQPVSPQDFAFLEDAVHSSSRKSFDSGKFSKEAILISDEIGDNGDNFGDKTQKFLRQFREKLNDSLVIEVLELVRSPELAVKFFIWAGRQIGYSHTVRVYHALLDGLGFDKNTRVPEHFLKKIREDDKEVLGNLLNVLIRKCCRNGFWNAALEELGRLKDFGYKPSKSTYNALILLLLKADRLDTAYLVHREMVDSGFNMDGFTMGYFAQSLCKAGRWRDALRIIEEEEFEPDTVIYNKMISGLCEASLFEEAMDFLHRMRTNSCIPNVETFETLLTGCLRKRQLGRCKRILSMMITEGCYPTRSIFKYLVDAYCRSGDYIYAYKLLKKMVNCGYVPGYVVYNILIGGICGREELPSSDILELAEKAYCEMLDAGFVLNKVNVGHFSRCLCEVGKFEKAFSVIREMMAKGFIPDSSTYSKVIGFLCQASKVEKAILLFEEMKKNGIVPDVFTYTILIDSFCKADLIEPAHNLFDEMVRDGCAPNVVTYTSLIHAYLKVRKVSNANDLFERMLSEGWIPNIITYTALIDGHCKAGHIDRACQIYGRMRGNSDIPDVEMYFRSDGSNLIKPNVVTYGALVDGLCKAHKVGEALDLLEAMSKAGCEPNQIVYDALIDGFCKVGKLDEAQEIFTKMSENGYSPNVYTYSSLIDRLFKDKRLDLALKVLSKMLENACPPNVVTYTEMIDGLCKVGKADEAYKLLVMMEEKGCCPNVVSYTAMIDGFGKVGKVNMCLEVLRQMVAKGCAPNFVTYSVLIKHCCLAGLLDEAHKLLEEMKQTYWPRYVTGYRKVIEGFSREFIASLGLLNEITEGNTMPIAPTYRILIDSFCKAGRLEVALELYEEMLTSSVFSYADRNTYSSLIECLSLASKVEKAFELYADMTRRGHIPDISVFFFLIKGLVKVNKWDEALQLSDSIYHMDIYWHPREGTINQS